MTRRKLIGSLTAAAVAALAFATLAPTGTALAGDEKTASEAAKVGSPAPAFSLTDTTGKAVKLADLTKQGKIVVLEWFNPGCPVVKGKYEHGDIMNQTANEFSSKNVVWLRVNSTNPKHQDFGKDKGVIESWHITQPILLDSDGKVGKSYGAKTTPHMFIVDSKGILAYAGAIDNDSKGNTADDKKVNYVKQALNEIIAGETVSTPTTQSYGCGVKYAS